MKISAVIISYNEEKNIKDAIRSASWADEVLVVDSQSTDRTREIAESLGARVVVNSWPGFSQQKQFAVDRAANDWIFSLDSDERVSPALEKEILELKNNKARADAYKIPRLSYYMGRAIKHGGWYPDLQLRLFDRRKGAWNGRIVHESFQMTAGSEVRKLSGHILHYSVDDAAHHNKMIAERYAPLGAQAMYREGRRTSRPNAVGSALFAFIRAYILKLGFLDGFAGFCIAYFAAHHTFMKHLMLMERLRTQREGAEPAQ
ncbi:MAG TPA: glycosyltransferase family 2 protein [Pyrinomonadaceae bacterium]|nr:glycosyltransferase family 2 protein [Pyrinomonadaceae bacterium]